MHKLLLFLLFQIGWHIASLSSMEQTGLAPFENMPAEIVWHIYTATLTNGDLKGFNRLSLSNKRYNEIKKEYLTHNKQQQITPLLETFKKQASSIQSELVELNNNDIDYVAHMNLLVSFIKNDEYRKDSEVTLYAALVLDHIKKSNYDINKNFAIKEHIQQSSTLIIGTLGSVTGISFYTWYISRMPLIEACRNQHVRLVAMLLACGAMPQHRHFLYENKTYSNECALEVAASTENSKIIALIKETEKKKSNCLLS